MNALDLINGMGKRMPGFVWMMEGSGEPGTGNTETKIGGDPQFVSNLTVWESVETLENFVWNTVHRQFYERREEWFEVMDKMHFVMWWIEPGHQPTLDEALERLDLLNRIGDSEEAFGWSYLKEARLWRSRGCRGDVAWRTLLTSSCDGPPTRCLTGAPSASNCPANLTEETVAMTSPLFTPFKLKNMELPNRVVMAPMTRSKSPGGVPGRMSRTIMPAGLRPMSG
jgi:hypothetical protein